MASTSYCPVATTPSSAEFSSNINKWLQDQKTIEPIFFEQGNNLSESNNNVLLLLLQLCEELNNNINVSTQALTDIIEGKLSLAAVNFNLRMVVNTITRFGYAQITTMLQSLNFGQPQQVEVLTFKAGAFATSELDKFEIWDSSKLNIITQYPNKIIFVLILAEDVTLSDSTDGSETIYVQNSAIIMQSSNAELLTLVKENQIELQEDLEEEAPPTLDDDYYCSSSLEDVIDEVSSSAIPHDWQQEALNDPLLHSEEISNNDTPKFFANQEKLAAQLYNNIRNAIGQEWDNFTSYDYLIITPAFHSLKDQTKTRVKQAGLDADKVIMFSSTYIDIVDKWKRSIAENQNMLHICIADECHYASTKNNFFDSFLNDETLHNATNFVILFVSATPYNMLTKNSRIRPNNKFVRLNNDFGKYKKGDMFVMVTSNSDTSTCYHCPSNTPQTIQHYAAENLASSELIGLPTSSITTINYHVNWFTSSNEGAFPNSIDSVGYVRLGDLVRSLSSTTLPPFIDWKTPEFTKWIKEAFKIESIKSFATTIPYFVSKLAVYCAYLTKKYNLPKTINFDDAFLYGWTDFKIFLTDGNNSLKCNTEQLNSIIKELWKQLTFVWQKHFSECIRCDYSFYKFLQSSKKKLQMPASMKAKELPDPEDILLLGDYIYFMARFALFSYYDNTVESVLVWLRNHPKIKNKAGAYEAFFTDDIEATNEIELLLNCPTNQLTLWVLNEATIFDVDMAIEVVELLFPSSKRGIFLHAISDLKLHFGIQESYIQQAVLLRLTYYVSLVNDQVEVLNKAKTVCKSDVVRAIITAHVMLGDAIPEDLQAAIATLKAKNCNRKAPPKTFMDLEESHRIIRSLFVSSLNCTKERKLVGKLKIVRLKKTCSAECFYLTLRKIRNSALLNNSDTSHYKWNNKFAIVPDFGTTGLDLLGNYFYQLLQPNKCEVQDCECNELVTQEGNNKICSNCTHEHREISEYTRLHGLPCLLVLVNKGRMGDTFPHTFDCMDLRLRYNGSISQRASITQELGRLCRYVKWKVKMTDGQLPYALVGAKLYRALQKVADSPDPMKALATTTPSIGMKKIRNSKDKDNYRESWVATESRCDYKNELQYPLRFLLEAEPQVGKTGTFLCLLVNWIAESLTAEVQPTLTESSLSFSVDDMYPNVTELLNQPPIWDYFKTHKFSGKYTCFGTYQSSATAAPAIHSSSASVTNANQQPKLLRKIVQTASTNRALVARNILQMAATHTPTATRRRFVTKLGDAVVSISLPSIYVKHFVIQNQQDEIIGVTSQQTDLKSWIFTPSYNRAHKAKLDYSLVMDKKSYVHIVFVRHAQFDNYSAIWGKYVGVVALPDVPEASTEGVGFVRYYIQLFASNMKLKFIWMLDDNILQMGKTKLPVRQPTELNNNNNHAAVQRELTVCSFYSVLKHMEQQLYEESTWNKAGNPKLYASLGMYRYSSYCNVKNNFERKHIYSAMLINIENVCKHDIWFRKKGFSIWEDLRFNDDCDEKNLLVCRYNIFFQVKVQFKSDLIANIDITNTINNTDTDIVDDTDLIIPTLFNYNKLSINISVVGNKSFVTLNSDVEERLTNWLQQQLIRSENIYNNNDNNNNNNVNNNNHNSNDNNGDNNNNYNNDKVYTICNHDQNIILHTILAKVNINIIQQNSLQKIYQLYFTKTFDKYNTLVIIVSKPEELYQLILLCKEPTNNYSILIVVNIQYTDTIKLHENALNQLIAAISLHNNVEIYTSSLAEATTDNINQPSSVSSTLQINDDALLVAFAIFATNKKLQVVVESNGTTNNRNSLKRNNSEISSTSNSETDSSSNTKKRQKIDKKKEKKKKKKKKKNKNSKSRLSSSQPLPTTTTTNTTATTTTATINTSTTTTPNPTTVQPTTKITAPILNNNNNNNNNASITKPESVSTINNPVAPDPTTSCTGINISYATFLKLVGAKTRKQEEVEKLLQDNQLKLADIVSSSGLSILCNAKNNNRPINRVAKACLLLNALVQQEADPQKRKGMWISNFADNKNSQASVVVSLHFDTLLSPYPTRCSTKVLEQLKAATLALKISAPQPNCQISVTDAFDVSQYLLRTTDGQVRLTPAKIISLIPPA